MLTCRPVDWNNRYSVPFGARQPIVVTAIAQDAAPKSKEIVLAPVRPNVGVQAKFKKKIANMIECMHKSWMRFIMAAYKTNEPRVVALAEDASPANEINDVVKRLKRRWFKAFDQGAKDLAGYFATTARKRTDATLKDILKRSGISIEFQMTRAQQDIAAATVHESVSLIKSIPEQYSKQVEGIVMRGVQNGRDAHSIASAIEDQFGKTKKRAAFIARDQNNKATAAFNRARQLELGIDEAEWHHSGAGKHPRPTHVAAGARKQRFKVSEGWFDPAVKEYIQPGVLPNCRCTSRSIIPGFI